MKRLLLLGLFAVAARAVDVSGVYENAGTVVSTTLASPEAGVPFRGLVGLEFDLPLARALHSDTERVTLTQVAGTFTMRCTDAAGAETWTGQWERDRGYGIEGNQVKLIFRSKRFADDGFLFLLTPVGDETLLQVEVLRVHSTFFGPVGKPIGTFLFHRLAGR